MQKTFKCLTYTFVLQLAFFFFAQVSWAKESKIPISIPDNLVKIESVYGADESVGVWIVHVQDAHCVVEAQKNTQRLIDYLQRKYGLKHVYLEGGEGKLNTAILRDYPNLEVKQAVLEKYLARGEISGAEYAACVNEKPASYFGIENQSLYDLNRKILLEADRSRARRDQILVDLRKRIEMKLSRTKPIDSKNAELSESLKQVDLLLRASRLDLERKDYQKFIEIYRNLSKSAPLFFHALGITEQSEDWVDLASFFAPVIKFYELVLKRDLAMSFNVLRRVREDKPKVAVLITGGFHSEGIGRILSRAGISTVVVTPKFTSWMGKENYIPVLRKNLKKGQVPSTEKVTSSPFAQSLLMEMQVASPSLKHSAKE